MKTLYLINHSHTDIGYTARQEDIMMYHVDFIRQAMQIIDNELQDHQKTDFVWTCENYWQVENFYAHASEAEKHKFEDYLNRGYIDLGLNYFNMTELVDQQVLNNTLHKGRTFAQTIPRQLNSAMMADINGMSWSYCGALLNNGITNLFTCVHAHHGLYPLFDHQRPFWWDDGTGRKLLVWNGELYHFGNELYIMPDAQTSYQITDEFVGDMTSPQLKIAHERITRYFADLEQRGYPYDFVPSMISGFISDNAGPNVNILTAIHEWNHLYGEKIRIQMTGLNDFFQLVRQQTDVEIPTYRGDWNDWWADGVGSTPGSTKIYRNAQRTYHLTNLLSDGATEADPDVQAAEKDLMLFAEHTWGYSSSVSEPWNTMVNELDYRKSDYAIQASVKMNTAYNRVLDTKFGRAYPRANRHKTYRVINPHDVAVKAPTNLVLEYWESVDGKRITDEILPYIEVFDRDTGEVYPRQIVQTPRAYEVEIVVDLAPKEEKHFGIRLGKTDHRPQVYYSFIQGAEGVRDIDYPGKPNELTIDTSFYTAHLSATTGLADLVDKQTGKNLLRELDGVPAFSGIYEDTPIKTDPCEERRRMGRNRKGKGVKRYYATLTNIRTIARGEVFHEVALDYELEGTQMYTVVLKFYQDLPLVKTTVRVQKDNTWDPENLYVAMPLAANADLYAEKSGQLFRPAIDQLPGTNTDFFLLDSGLFYREDSGYTLGMCFKDTPLITLGNLDPGLIHLCDETTAYKNREPIYAWVMNNFWETNFKVDLSGFYEFEFDLFSAEKTTDIEAAHALLRRQSLGIVSVITDESGQ